MGERAPWTESNLSAETAAAGVQIVAFPLSVTAGDAVNIIRTSTSTAGLRPRQCTFEFIDSLALQRELEPECSDRVFLRNLVPRSI